MKSSEALADIIARNLEQSLRVLPEGFLDTFRFTRTGSNYTHPVVLGLLARVLWNLEGVRHVGIDVRFNHGDGAQFQPDLVAFGDLPEKPLVFVDYASPNSSDARVPEKDVDSYVRWRDGGGMAAPYVIVTTLPDKPSPAWELRWTHGDYCNSRFKGQEEELRQNPLRCWLPHYRKEFAKRDMIGIVVLNVSGTAVSRVHPPKPAC